MTYNYRPIKALKYVKQEDSVFGVAHVASAACYPGQGNLRVRWNGVQIRDIAASDLGVLRGMAVTNLAAETKNVKNTLKNAIADPVFIRLVAYSEIGKIGGSLCQKNAAGETVMLGDAPGIEPSLDRIGLLPEERLLKEQVILGVLLRWRSAQAEITASQHPHRKRSSAPSLLKTPQCGTKNSIIL